MNDFKGNELFIGDLVHFVVSNSLYEGRIDSMTAKQCKVRQKDGLGNYTYMYTIRYPAWQLFKLG